MFGDPHLGSNSGITDLFQGLTQNEINDLVSVGKVSRQPATESLPIAVLKVRLEGSNNSYIEISIDESTNAIVVISQVLHLPLTRGMPQDAIENSPFFELYYKRLGREDILFEFSFFSGSIFANVRGNNFGFKNLKFGHRVNRLLDRGIENIEYPLDLEFATGNVQVSPGDNGNVTSTIIFDEETEQKVMLHDHGVVFNPESGKIPKPLSFFYGDESSRWQASLDITTGGASFELIIPGMGVISGNYQLVSMPNWLKMAVSGNHRPLIPISMDIHSN